jgi:iron(III) transport system ATP-binding protein
MNAIALHEVSKRFGDRLVLDRFSMTVARGEAVALLGPSGAGKTTLLRLIAGLERPDAGRIEVRDVLASAPGILVPPWMRGIGMVFQDLALWPHMRVQRQLNFVVRGVSRTERRARVEALLELGGLEARRRAFPAQLSGGEQQRVAILRTLAAHPPILLLDEPFAHLDAALRERIVDHLLELKAAGQVSFVVALHHDAAISRLADRPIVLDGS